MRFSVVVPMYNVEKYLNKCIESLVIQSFQDIEIILVDDMSTDSTLEIASKWGEEYSNIQVIKKNSNSGLSDARNSGIASATGEYVAFIDSDDYIERKSFEVFDKIIERMNPDIIYAGFMQENERGNKERKRGFVSNPERLYTSHDYMINELRHRNLFASAAFGIYRRELLISNHLFFKSGILHEDEEWTPRVLMHANSVFLSSYYFYHYVKRKGSITTKRDRTQNGLDLMETCIELDKYAKEMISDKQLLSLYNNQLAKLYMKATSVGELYRKKYRNNVDKLFPIRRALMPIDRAKAILFAANLRLYAACNTLVGDDWR